MRSSRKALVFFDFLLLATIAIALSREREEAISSSRSFIAATDAGGEGDLLANYFNMLRELSDWKEFRVRDPLSPAGCGRRGKIFLAQTSLIWCKRKLFRLDGVSGSRS
jgi:hypothetical protein